MKRLSFATLVVGAALLSACGVPDSPTAGNGVAVPPVASPTQPPVLSFVPTIVPPTAVPPTATPVAAVPRFSTGDLATLKPTDVLVQLEYEPTFTMPEFIQPFGRIAAFTLLADGSLFYLDEDAAAETPQQRLMRVQLSPEQTSALVQQYLDAGLAQVASYSDMCEPGAGDNKACIADAAYTVTRIRLPGGALHESRNYASFATAGDVLKTIAEQLQAYTNPAASEYQPEHATLFIAPAAEKPDGVTVLDWPLGAEWLAAPRTGVDQWANVVEGSDLAALLKAVPHSNGVRWFKAGDTFFRTSLVPWLPGHDYRAAVAAYQMPPVEQITPQPTPDAPTATP